MIYEEIVHIKGHPKQLVIFLHGYADGCEYADNELKKLLDGIDNIALHIPKSPTHFDLSKQKYQWYSIHKYDPNSERKTVKTLAECVDIYSKMKISIVEASQIISRYIDNCLSEYGLEDKDLFIAGYSQGATLAMFTSLMRENKIAGTISFSGILAPEEYVMSNYKTPQDILLIHGNKDKTIRFDALEYSKDKLSQTGSIVKAKVLDEGTHQITEEAIKYARDFIAQRSLENKK